MVVLSEEELAEALRTIVSDPTYVKVPIRDIMKLPTGRYVKYVLRSTRTKGRYTIGAGFFKNHYYDPKKSRHVMWIHNKRREKPMPIIHTNIAYVFLKVGAIERLAASVEDAKKSELAHTVNILTAIKAAAR
jgi:hypothetical protein